MRAIQSRLPWLLILASVLVLSACAAHDMEGRPLDLGQSREGYLRDGVYHNDFYQFTWKAPLGWSAVKPTPLEALVSRPQPDRGYMFGWANPAQQAEIRFLVFPAPPEVRGDCSPQVMARGVAQEQGWRPLSEQPGQWQGRPATQVHYSTLAGLGQPSGAVIARFICSGKDLLVFQLQMPAIDYNSMHDLFQELLRQVQFAKAPQEPPREAAPPPLPDLVHTVKSSAETLAAIAQWYAGNAALAQRIQAYNQIPEPVRLAAGQQIKIPSEIVTNRHPMPPPLRKKPAVKPSGKRGDDALEPGEAAAPAEPAARPEPAPEPAAPAIPPPAPAPGGLQLEPIGPK